MLFVRDDEITEDSLQDTCYHVGCGDCEFFRVNADREESRCKRIDHKRIRFYVPWFKSYDCGQRSAVMCADFKPAKWHKYLYEHWTDPVDYAAMGDINRIKDSKKWVSLRIANDPWVYRISAWDFWNNTFLEEDGSLKWASRWKYIRTRSSPTGYAIQWEYANEERR